jgi:hypothetical protein
VIAEAKGSDIDHALKQLTSLADYVHQKYPQAALEFHILMREGSDPSDLMPAKNQEPRYRAKSTNETLFWKEKYVLTDGKGEPVRIALNPRERGDKIFVIIGPRAERGDAE